MPLVEILGFASMGVLLGLCIGIRRERVEYWIQGVATLHDGIDWLLRLHTLPSRRSMVYNPKYWLLVTEEDWQAWVDRHVAEHMRLNPPDYQGKFFQRGPLVGMSMLGRKADPSYIVLAVVDDYGDLVPVFGTPFGRSFPIHIEDGL